MQLKEGKRLEFDININLENSYFEETDVEEKMLIKRKRSYGYFLSYKLSDIYGSKQTENCKMKNAS